MNTVMRCFLIAAKLTLILTLLTATGASAAEDLLNAFREGKINGKFRVLFFQRNFDERITRESLAVGGKLHYETAPLWGIRAGASFYTSHDPFGVNDDDKAVYDILASDRDGNHDSYDVLGEYYFEARWEETTIKIGGQEISTPWLNRFYNRMTPITYEAYTLKNQSIPGLKIIASHVTKIKEKTASKFVPVSESFSTVKENKPVTLGGLIYSGLKDLKFQVWDYYAYDLFNNFYFQCDYKLNFNKDVRLFTYAGYLDQQAIDERLLGSRLDNTYLAGGRAGIHYYGLTLTFGYMEVGNDDIQKRWGERLPVLLQTSNSLRAEEASWMIKVAYDFSRVGAKGLTAYTLYARKDRPHSGTNADTDIEEMDFNVKYKFGNTLEGWSIRARCALNDQEEDLRGEDFTDIRFYLEYNFGPQEKSKWP